MKNIALYENLLNIVFSYLDIETFINIYDKYNIGTKHNIVKNYVENILLYDKYAYLRSYVSKHSINLKNIQFDYDNKEVYNQILSHIYEDVHSNIIELRTYNSKILPIIKYINLLEKLLNECMIYLTGSCSISIIYKNIQYNDIDIYISYADYIKLYEYINEFMLYCKSIPCSVINVVNIQFYKHDILLSPDICNVISFNSRSKKIYKLQIIVSSEVYSPLWTIPKFDISVCRNYFTNKGTFYIDNIGDIRTKQITTYNEEILKYRERSFIENYLKLPYKSDHRIVDIYLKFIENFIFPIFNIYINEVFTLNKNCILMLKFNDFLANNFEIIYSNEGLDYINHNRISFYNDYYVSKPLFIKMNTNSFKCKRSYLGNHHIEFMTNICTIFRNENKENNLILLLTHCKNIRLDQYLNNIKKYIPIHDLDKHLELKLVNLLIENKQLYIMLNNDKKKKYNLIKHLFINLNVCKGSHYKECTTGIELDQNIINKLTMYMSALDMEYLTGSQTQALNTKDNNYKIDFEVHFGDYTITYDIIRDAYINGFVIYYYNIIIKSFYREFQRILKYKNKGYNISYPLELLFNIDNLDFESSIIVKIDNGNNIFSLC